MHLSRPNGAHLKLSDRLSRLEKLAKLVPNAKQITNTNSSHEIHKEQPQLVIDSIRNVVDAVRDRRQHD
jgi:hypothetical protein